ncbi:hypothetical protein BSL78_14658 [Apostichopus japonicus]|uniref:Fibrinogen C-terminal domain-containing protein n=1 Tax=Stichopus japonicus TaxID=307972 RepID=A0A2G8KKD2_STIJA|nr:hypothetical protein BSL78_14658 [Apostichopus japonicus]
MTNYQLIEVATRTTPSELTTKPGAKTATESSTTKITTTAQEGPSISTNMGADCVIPNNNYDALNHGSLLVNANCTRTYKCSNGHILVNEAYSCNSNANCEIRGDVRKCYCNEGYTGNGETCVPTNMTNCWDYFDAGFTVDGLYIIKPSYWTGVPFTVFCNMTDGGGWTIFQRRTDGSVDFNRNWMSYKEGFGELDHEFWLGNDKLYYLTNQGDYQLRIDMVNKDGAPYYAKYDLFRIHDESDNYRLSELGTYSGTAGLGYELRYHLNHSFSTIDRDNDAGSNRNCADIYKGGWWFNDCAFSNLNGVYLGPSPSGIYWYDLPAGSTGILYTEMKIRPV